MSHDVPANQNHANGAGAGVASAVWPGQGTVIGYNVADIAITFMIVNPLVDTYFGGLPPPAAMDAGVLQGDPPLPHPQTRPAATDAAGHRRLSSPAQGEQLAVLTEQQVLSSPLGILLDSIPSACIFALGLGYHVLVQLAKKSC